MIFSIIVFLLVNTISLAYASDIQMLSMPVKSDFVPVQILEEKKYFICDSCPVESSINKIVEVNRSPVVIKVEKVIPQIAVHDHDNDIKQKQEKDVFELTVYFSLNDYRLKGGEKQKLNSAVPYLEKAEKIAITGYTCILGSKSYNDKLALKRAMTVARYLELKGVPKERMNVEGIGKCCYIDKTKSVLNRRVEIKTLNK